MRRTSIWMVVAVLFTLANVGAVWFAAMAGEMLHAGGHVVLAFGGAFVAWHLAPKRAAIR